MTVKTDELLTWRVAMYNASPTAAHMYRQLGDGGDDGD